tara:strand:+ start:95 stop:1150 length:1056 start_codon:yes stop_codon:yes gene_type:complete
MSTEVFEKLGNNINEMVKLKNYQLNPRFPKGKPGSNDKRYREYRLNLINKEKDTSKDCIAHLGNKLRLDTNITQIRYNEVSPNSSKFPSFSFVFDGQMYDVIIARGANAGEKFETRTVTNLDNFFKIRQSSEMSGLIGQMNESNEAFAQSEIVSAKQRTGATKKEGVPIAKLGAIIGDIVLQDSNKNEWFVSLKDVNGNTFSSYSGAASLFDKDGNLQPNSKGAEFLNSFGVDLNLVQSGFDERGNINKIREKIPVKKLNPKEVEFIFRRAWGMNYFYVRRKVDGWKVFWLGKEKLDKLAKGIKVTAVRYPSKKSKQITIMCSNTIEDYVIEVRNSKAQEYPNDTKFKVKK